MIKLNQHGQFKIWARDLADGSREFQVREGNRILSRHSRWLDAEEEAAARLDIFWDEMAQELKRNGRAA